MLYLIYGEDTYRARKNAREIVINLTARDMSAQIHRVDGENASEEKISDLISGQDLFGHKSVVVFDGVLESEFADFLSARTKEMAESINVYIVLGKKPDSKLVKKISKFAAKTKKFGKLSAGEAAEWIKSECLKRRLTLRPDEVSYLAENFGQNLWAVARALELKELGDEINIEKFLYNPFRLAELFIFKKRREAYKYFHDNLAGGVSSEEMFWKLWWQIKTLLAVSAEKQKGLNNFQIGQKTGMNSSVIQKCSDALSRFALNETEKTWDDLFYLWRASRSEKVELELGLERLILGPAGFSYELSEA